jgi:GrpB-like predicted nucleotidyltransferase (UPF0157 family)
MSSPQMIEIVPYDPRWPERFAEVAGTLRRSLEHLAVRIDHIGSTAVPGLAGKPILDLQISVASFEPLDAFKRPLESLGYVYRATNTERTKRYFREQPGTQRTHIHVREAGSFSEQFALLLRDYLRAHPQDASEYEQLKRRLADRHPHDRFAYTQAKEDFTWALVRRADRWAQESGWMPPDSDG